MPKRIKVEKGREQYALEYAAALIEQGKAVAFPTDTYYGLAVDPFNLAAVNGLYELKQRDNHKPILLAVSSLKQAEELTGDLPAVFYRLAERFWPGPLTLVLPAAKRVPLRITANTGKIALRLPDCDLAVRFAEALGMPLTATSANISEMPECATPDEVAGQFGDRLSLILDYGPTPGGEASTILDVGHGRCRLIRPGKVPEKELEEFLSSED